MRLCCIDCKVICDNLVRTDYQIGEYEMFLKYIIDSLLFSFIFFFLFFNLSLRLCCIDCKVICDNLVHIYVTIRLTHVKCFLNTSWILYFFLFFFKFEFEVMLHQLQDCLRQFGTYICDYQIDACEMFLKYIINSLLFSFIFLFFFFFF